MRTADWKQQRAIALAKRSGMKKAAEIAKANKKRYPESVFIPPTNAQTRKVIALLRDNGLTLDAFSADVARMVSDNIALSILAERKRV